MVLLRTPGRFVPWPEAKMATPVEDAVHRGTKAPNVFFPVGRGTGFVKLYTYLLLNAFLCLVCRMALLVQVTDGQSDISVAMAKAIGMLPADAVPGIPILYDPWQTRMVAPCTTGDTSLSKGMVAVDEEQTEDMLLRRECRKVTWPTSALEEETFLN